MFSTVLFTLDCKATDHISLRDSDNMEILAYASERLISGKQPEYPDYDIYTNNDANKATENFIKYAEKLNLIKVNVDRFRFDIKDLDYPNPVLYSSLNPSIKRG